MRGVKLMDKQWCVRPKRLEIEDITTVLQHRQCIKKDANDDK